MRHKEAELDWLPRLCRPDAVSLDIGASHGLYSQRMLPLSAGVVAFEPVPFMYQRLVRFFGRRMVVHQVALSDRSGEVALRIPGDHTARATIAVENPLKVDEGTAVQTVVVPMRRLDDLALGTVGMIKIDVEGHEEAVLKGGLQTITRDRPNILVEIEERHNPGAFSRVSAMLGTLGYHGGFLRGGKLVPLAQFDPVRDQQVDAHGNPHGDYIQNFLFSTAPLAGG